MISSTELIRQWEEKELPMLREKEFRGDAERMAYTAFGDGFAFGAYASRLTRQDIERVVTAENDINEKYDRAKIDRMPEKEYYTKILERYNELKNGQG